MKKNRFKTFVRIISIIFAIIIGGQLIIKAGDQIKKNRVDMNKEEVNPLLTE